MKIHKATSLSAYVTKRTGVELGQPGSMHNMFKRSLGAGSFDKFWQYWNPIWGYYLSQKVMKPLRRYLPLWLATIITFSTSGALHDLAVTSIKWQFTFFFTPWFIFMSLGVLISKRFSIRYDQFHWCIRASLNIAFIVISFIFTTQLERFYMH